MVLYTLACRLDAWWYISICQQRRSASCVTLIVVCCTCNAESVFGTVIAAVPTPCADDGGRDDGCMLI